VVLADAEAKSREMIARRRGQETPVPAESALQASKSLRREGRMIRPSLWWLPPVFYSLAVPWVRSAPGLPCTLYNFRGHVIAAQLGRPMPREWDVMSHVLIPTRLEARLRNSKQRFSDTDGGLAHFGRVPV
jgi:hypothetical protein